MKTYSFTLILTRPTVDDESAAEHLYTNGCDDALFNVSSGIYALDFDRKAANRHDAVQSAVSDAHSAGIGVRVVKVLHNPLWKVDPCVPTVVKRPADLSRSYTATALSVTKESR